MMEKFLLQNVALCSIEFGVRARISGGVGGATTGGEAELFLCNDNGLICSNSGCGTRKNVGIGIVNNES